jgi:hypothetical protein
MVLTQYHLIATITIRPQVCREATATLFKKCFYEDICPTTVFNFRVTLLLSIVTLVKGYYFKIYDVIFPIFVFKNFPLPRSL